MSCDIAYFEPTSCTSTIVNLCDVEDAGNYSIKLTHTGTNKSYWFDAPLATTIQLILTDFNVDTDVPYKFEVYNLQSSLNTPISFSAFGAASYTYTTGQFSFYSAQTAGETVPTVSILQIK